MTKIMLVEDDNNLREIYEARLLAEGYEIVSAKDGEEALALAVKEKPDLIISDVMMPKISGFDMLDILRSTPETKNTKVIMMTALSQAEDKTRADKLGADRYLVKSQVTLEDVAKVAHEVLTGEAATPASATPDPMPAAPATPAPADPAATATPAEPAAATPVVAPPAPAPDAAPASTPAAPADPAATTASTEIAPTTADESAQIDAQINDFIEQATSTEPAPAPAPEVSAPAPEPAPVDDGALPSTTSTEESIAVKDAPPEATTESAAGDKANQLAEAVNKIVEANSSATAEVGGDASPTHKKVISPINDDTKAPDLNELLAKEAANEALPTPPADTVVAPGSDPTPATAPTDEEPAPTPDPGNVIAPSGDDPNNVAL
jgi:CheY-like chemotaxis protein